MHKKRSETVTLYFDDGTEIEAYPQFATAEPSLFLWLTADAGDMIQCIDDRSEEFVHLKIPVPDFAPARLCGNGVPLKTSWARSRESRASGQSVLTLANQTRPYIQTASVTPRAVRSGRGGDTPAMCTEG